MSDAETIRARGVIGAAMEDPARRERLAAMLTGQEFGLTAHRRIWNLLTDLGSRYEEVTTTDLHAALVEQGGDAMELLTEMSLCLDETLPGRLGRAESYARAIRRDHARRTVSSSLEGVLGDLSESTTDGAESAIERARKSIEDATRAYGSDSPAMNVGDLATSEIVAAVHDDRPPMIPSGLGDFDRLFGGLAPTFIIVAGRPAMGKSTLTLCLGVNAALSGKRVVIISMEDSRQVVTARILGRFAGVDYSKILRRTLNESEKARLIPCEEMIHRLPLVIDDTPARDSATIRADVLRHRDAHGADLVIVDHLGKVRDQGSKLYERASAASAALANLQRELTIPLVCVHQMNRGEKSQRTNTPQIDDLRDSGWIEADARQIILLHRLHYYYQTGLLKDPPPKHEITLVVGKNNYGPTGAIKCYCDMKTAFIGDNPDQQEGY